VSSQTSKVDKTSVVKGPGWKCLRPSVEAAIKAIIDTIEGMRLQVSFGDETALISQIYPWQIVVEAL
jgi:hypothetical protein